MTHKLIFILFWAAFLTQASCKDDNECSNNSHCNSTEICRKGKCVDDPTLIPDTMTSSDSISDVSSDSISDSDSWSDTDSRSDSDSTPITIHECITDDQCDDTNPCTADYCNTSASPYSCDASVQADGVSCDDGDPCNGPDVCEGGVCTHNNPLCANSTPAYSCLEYVAECTPAGATQCTYSAVALADGTPCLNTNSCAPGICAAGECTNVQNPCDESAEKCVKSTCEVTGATPADYVCHTEVAPDGQQCVYLPSESPCYETGDEDYNVSGHCYATGDSSKCFIGDRRHCYDEASPSICAAQVCVLDDGSCLDIPQADVSISTECNASVAISDSDFVTRHYYKYNIPCIPIDVRGKEVALSLNITAATNVTVTVINDGGQEISLHHLTDMCDPNTCQSNAYDSLSVTGMLPTDAILVEAGIGEAPVGIELSVTCD